MKPWTLILLAALCSLLISCAGFSGTVSVPIADANGRTLGFVSLTATK